MMMSTAITTIIEKKGAIVDRWFTFCGNVWSIVD